MKSTATHAAAALGGLVAGAALASPPSGDLAFVTDDRRLDVLIYGEAAGAAAGLVVAAIVAWRLREHRTLVLSALLGSALLAVAVAATGFAPRLYFAAAGAGLLLGALAGLSTGSDNGRPRYALSVGTLAGVLFGQSLIDATRSTPRRYADYLPADVGDAANAGPVMLILLALTAAVLLICLRETGFAPAVRPPARTVAAAICLAAAGLVLYWWKTRTVDALLDSGAMSRTWMSGTWYYGIALVPVVVAVVLWLPGRLGEVLLATAAVTFAGGGNRVFEHDLASAFTGVAALAIGAALGRRSGTPYPGFAALALVAASAAIVQPGWDTVQLTASVVLLPLAAGYTVAACLPTAAPMLSTGLALPAVFTAPLIAQFEWIGWTAYTPLTNTVSSDDRTMYLAVAASVAAVAVCALTLAWVRRRPEPTANPGPSS